MKWKWTLPYILTGAAVLTDLGVAPSQNGYGASELPYEFPAMSSVYSASYSQVAEYEINEARLNNKADSLRDKYVANMLNAQEKLHPLMGRRSVSIVCMDNIRILIVH
jgi:hypothetical protein